MKKSLKLVLVTLIVVGSALFALAQAVPTDEMLYEPVRNDSGDFVIVKWTANPRAVNSKYVGNFKDPNRGIVTLTEDVKISAKSQTDAIGNSNEIAREFTLTIPYGVGKQLTDTTPNFRIEVTPYVATMPSNSVKPTGSILLNMKVINDYFKMKNDLDSEQKKSSNLNNELNKSKSDNAEQKSKNETLKAENDRLVGELTSGNNAKVPKFESPEVTNVTHKSAFVKIKSISDQYVKVKAVAYLGNNTKNRDQSIKYEGKDPKYIAPNTSEEFIITNIPPGTPFFIVLQEEFVTPPNPVREAKEEIAKEYKGKPLATKSITGNIEARINFFAAAPKIINNEKIVANATVANANSYQIILEAFDNKNQPKTLYVSEQIKVEKDGEVEITLPIEKFKLTQGSEYRLKAVAQAKNEDVSPNVEDTSLKFIGLRDKMFNNFALGVDKDGLGFKIIGVQEQSANFTLALELENKPSIPIDCVFSNSGNDRSCKLDFQGVVNLVAAFNNLSQNKVNAVTFKVTAEATDGSKRKESQVITFLVDSTPATENSRWQSARSFAKKLLNPEANKESSIKVKDIIGNGIAGLIGLIAPFL